MAIAGPFVSFGIYKLCETLKVNKMVSVFLAAMLGDIFTYCVTSLQLAAAYPSDVGGFMASAVKFLGVFAPTQLPSCCGGNSDRNYRYRSGILCKTGA